MRTYLAGPMRNHVRFNFPAFDAAAADLRASGIEVISPAELDRKYGFDPIRLPNDWDWMTLPEDFALHHAVERDIAAILQCDAIHLLPGWKDSKGARAERAVAEWLGLAIFEYHPQGWCSNCNNKRRIATSGPGWTQYTDCHCVEKLNANPPH